MDNAPGLRRPLFWFSAIFLCALALSLCRGEICCLFVGCVVFLCSTFLKGHGRRRGLLLAGGLACLLALGLARGQRLRLERWQALAGQTVDFTGWVQEENPFVPGRGRVEGTVPLEGALCPVVLDIRGLGEELSPGSWLSGSLLVLEARQDGDARGGVSLYGIAQGEAAAIPAPDGVHPAARLVAARRELSGRAWQLSRGEDAGVVLSMVFSRQELLSRALLERMDRAGLRHLLVVSGLHLSMAVGWVLAACRQLGLGERAASLAALPAVWLMAGMAGFSVSVIRAGVMSTLWLAGRCLGRRADSLTSLAFAALLLAVLSPPVVLQTGWQLTFSATLGVLLGAEPMAGGLAQGWESRFGRPGRPARWLLESLSASICAQLGTLPVLAAAFGGFSVWGLVTTLLSMPFAAGTILLGGLGCALLPWAGTAAAGELLFAAARAMARCILAIAALADRLPGGMVPVLLPHQLALCFLAPALVLGYPLLRPRLRPSEARLLRRGLLAGAAVMLLCGWAFRRNAVVVSAGDTGSVVVAAPGGTVVLASGEGDYRQRALSAQLLRCGAAGPVVLVCPWDSSLNGILWWQQNLSPAVSLAPAAELPLLREQAAGPFLPLQAEPVEVLPGVLVSHPAPQVTCVEAAGRKVLKSWAGYGIIAGVPLAGDLLVDMDGRVYPLSPGLRPGKMPTGDTNLLLPAGR